MKKIKVKGYSRKFNASKLPKRDSKGRFRKKTTRKKTTRKKKPAASAQGRLGF